MLPPDHGLECRCASHVENYETAYGVLIIHASHVIEALLARYVPQLETYERVRIPVDDLESEVYSDLNLNKNKVSLFDKSHLRYTNPSTHCGSVVGTV